MARAKQQTGGSLTIWMILFVALWLTSTVVLVILYTSQEGLRNDNTRLSEDNLRLISPAERKAVTVFQSSRPGGPTVVGLIESGRADTAELATGDGADDAAAVQAKLDGLLSTIRSDGIVPDQDSYADVSYHEALSTLYESFGAEHARRGKAQDRVAELEAQVDRLIQEKAQERANLDKRANEMRQRLDDAEEAHTRYRRERDEQVASLARDSEGSRKQSDADLTDERQHSAALKEELARSRERTRALQEKFGGMMINPEEFSTARQEDGRILRAVPGDEVVYIDLGRQDRLVLGLRFAVYSTDDGIPANGRAKAQIEVVSIDAHSAECRINHIRANEVILEGDVVANPIYDRHRPVVFMVLGEFDLDHDGVSDTNGTAVIESMITEWGGTLSVELTALTDFVVLGRAPRRPRAPGETAPEQRERFNAMQRIYDRYAAIATSATTLAVPILPQEVFLNFLGYTRR